MKNVTLSPTAEYISMATNDVIVLEGDPANQKAELLCVCMAHCPVLINGWCSLVVVDQLTAYLYVRLSL